MRFCRNQIGNRHTRKLQVSEYRKTLYSKHGCKSNAPYSSLVYHQHSLILILLGGNHLIAHMHYTRTVQTFVIKEYLRLSSFELAFVLCESGALSTEPPPACILTSCCAQYLSRPL